MRVNERRYIRSDKMGQRSSGDLSAIENILIKRYTPLMFATVIGLVVMFLASLYLSSVSETQAANNRMAAMQQTLQLSQEVGRFVNENRRVLRELRSELYRNQPITSLQFRDSAETIAQKWSYLDLVTWAPAGKINNVYPLGLNKQLMSETLAPSILSGLKDSSKNLLMVLEGREGKVTKLTFHSGLFSGDAEEPDNGVLSLVSDFWHYFKSRALNEKKQRLPFSISLQETDLTLFEFGEQTLLVPENVYSAPIAVANTQWVIKTLIKPSDLQIHGFFWLIAGVLSIVLSLLSYRVICIYKQRSVDVQAGAYRANFDLLTGLPNRYHFSRRLSETIEKAKQDQADFAVLFMDIDNFKKMNDQLGQGAGDALLTTFSSRLEFAAKSTDLVARISGDEFVFVAREVDDVIKADLLAEKLKKLLQQPIEFAGQQHFVTVSMGVAMYPIDGDNVPALLHHSDQAMYAAKRAGRNRHFFFNETMREQAESYLIIHQDLLRGLEAGEFELYYQPLLNIKSQKIDICEALIRWNHPQKGLVMPDKFITVAEQTGAIREIGNWAFSQACRDIRNFSDSDINIKIAINHSISEYYSNRAFERWKGILRENSVTGDRFIFEIPEALLMDKKSVRMNVVTAMRKMGVQFAIDDFGTGHSAINYLRNYPADILKIDSSLIQGMQTNAKDRTLVEVVLILAKSLGKIVVAEGVEDDEVAAHLKELDCDYLQGNWLLEPKSINLLIPFLHQHMFEQE